MEVDQEYLTSLVDEFKLFILKRHSQADIAKQRVMLCQAFLRNEFVAKCRRPKQLKFLQGKGFSKGEIEDALYDIDERDCLKFSEGNLEDSDVEDGKAEAQRQAAAAAAANSVVAAPVAEEPRPVHDDLSDANLWRVGGTVYAYKGDHSYFPVQLLGFDYSRTGDTMKIAHQLENGAYGEPQFLPAGFKGVVPDEYPPLELLVPGTGCIAEYPDAYRGHYKEATLLSCAPQADGTAIVDIEWAHDSSALRGIDYRCVRLLEHPKKLQFEKDITIAERRRYQGTTERTTSSSSFPFNHLTPEYDMPERFCRTTLVKNFIHHPHLDIGTQPRAAQNAAAFVSQFGESQFDGRKTFPTDNDESLCNAFGFTFKDFERFSESKHFLKTNPIIEMAEQCVSRDSMFIDPEFPPTYFSLLGEKVEEPPANFGWERASKLRHRPRITSVGAHAIDLIPGYFSPKWLLNVVGSLQSIAEFEDMISPGEDGWTFGAYVIRLYLNGQWGFVIVDDFLPVDDKGRCLSLMSGTPAEIYPCLVEKALAKLEGSYMALKHHRPGLTLASVWERVSSNISEVMDHDLLPSKDALNENLHAFVRQVNNCLILARCRSPEGIAAGDERHAGFGFEEDCYWFVKNVSAYIPPGRAQPMYYFNVIRATRGGPPVQHIEVKREKFFRTMPREAIDQFGDLATTATSTQVSYWMSSSEYFEIFSRTTCLWFINNSQRTSIIGSFAGKDCGGRMDGDEKWLGNPQVFMSLYQPSEIILEVRLMDRRFETAALEGKGLQIHLVKGDAVERPLNPTDDVSGQLVAAGPMCDLSDDVETFSFPSSTIRVQINGGNYIIIPSVGGRTDLKFVIKVISISAFFLKRLQ